MTQRAIEYWVIPPEEDAEFVAAMEEVLAVYAQPYDAENPVIYMDEQPVQLVKETRTPLAATKTQPEGVDYEYERAGTASIFMLTEPVGDKRRCVRGELKRIQQCLGKRRIEEIETLRSEVSAWSIDVNNK